MSQRFLRLPWLLLGLCLLPRLAPAAPAEAFPGLDRKWTHYQSPNFELYSCRSEANSRDILERMELLRAVFLEHYKLPVRMPQPVTIFSFNSDKDFKGYLPANRRGVSYEGFCLAHPDRTVISLAPSWSGETAGQVVYHEYIHCLFHMAEGRPPAWFNEGVAELYSTIQADKKWVTYGEPIPSRVAYLRDHDLTPFQQLFATDYDSALFRTEEGTSLFYSESWALLHYLRFGENGFPPDKVNLFLRAASVPLAQDHPAEFRALTKELLGVDYPELEARLKKYVRTGSFMGRKVPRPAIAPPQSYAMRPVPTGEMAQRLAELSLRFTESGYANLAIRSQLDRQPDARLQEVLGAAAQVAGDADRARERWQAAIDLGTTNVAVYRELARLESNLLFGQFDLDYRMPAERAQRLRDLLNRSLAAAPDQIGGYEMLAWVEATAQKPDLANVLRVQGRFNTLQDKPRTLLALCLVRMRLGQDAEALMMLGQMDQLQPNEWVQFCTEVTRARLEKRPVDPSKLPPGRSLGRGTIIMPPKLELKTPH